MLITPLAVGKGLPGNYISPGVVELVEMVHSDSSSDCLESVAQSAVAVD